MAIRIFVAGLLLGVTTCAMGQFAPSGTSTSSGQSTSDECVLNPNSPACASQQSGQGTTSGGGMQSGQSAPDIMNPDLSGGAVNVQPGNAQQSQSGTDYLQEQGTTGPSTGTAANNAAAQQEQQQQNASKVTPETPEPENEFQNFVQISTGQRLPIFGATLFKNAPTSFIQATRIPITGNYIVGPGDELIISVWGPITLNARVMVNREGNIILPRIGPVNVAGVQYDQLHDHLMEAVGHYYKNFQLSVSLGRLRSIQVYVTGFARRPGDYTVSSLSTLVNALFTSGGPSAHGSMRDIQLKRQGKVVTHFDLYDFLLRGDSSQDVPLQPEDVIYIPPMGPEVAIAGAVRVPAIYELGKETTLGDGIGAAGGLSTVADGSQVLIERIKDHSSRSVEQIPLNDDSMKMALHDGDIIRITSLSPRIENAVILRGNVAVPGRYPYKQGMHVRDLIPTRESLLTPDFWKGQLAVKQLNPYQNPRTPQEMGTRPRSTKPTATEEHISENATEQDKTIIRLSAPEINWDYAVVQRINPVDLSTHLLTFNLGKALAGDESQNIELQPGDILTIFSQRDIAVPRDEQTRFVTIEGEIKAPGVYRIEPGDTLRKVLQRAGNITPNAYLYGTVLTRESARQQQQAFIQETYDAMAIQVQQRNSADIAGHPEDAAAVAMQTTAQQQMADNLKAVKASGRVVLEVRPSDKSIAELPDIPLEDGDRVRIPQRLEMVNVIGAVYRQSSYVYLNGTNVKHYLRLAGSATQTADLKHILLVRADGSVVDKKHVSGLWRGGFYDIRVLPGDTLVIPTKLATGTFQRSLRDWTAIASQFAIAGASLAVISGL